MCVCFHCQTRSGSSGREGSCRFFGSSCFAALTSGEERICSPEEFLEEGRGCCPLLPAVCRAQLPGFFQMQAESFCPLEASGEPGLCFLTPRTAGSGLWSLCSPSSPSWLLLLWQSEGLGKSFRHPAASCASHGLAVNVERLCAEKRWTGGNVPDKNETTCSDFLFCFVFPLASRGNFFSSIQSLEGTEIILQGTLHEVRDCFNY